MLVLKPWSSSDKSIEFHQTCGQNKSHHIFHGSSSRMSRRHTGTGTICKDNLPREEISGASWIPNAPNWISVIKLPVIK